MLTTVADMWQASLPYVARNKKLKKLNKKNRKCRQYSPILSQWM